MFYPLALPSYDEDFAFEIPEWMKSIVRNYRWMWNQDAFITGMTTFLVIIVSLILIGAAVEDYNKLVRIPRTDITVNMLTGETEIRHDVYANGHRWDPPMVWYYFDFTPEGEGDQWEMHCPVYGPDNSLFVCVKTPFEQPAQ